LIRRGTAGLATDRARLEPRRRRSRSVRASRIGDRPHADEFFPTRAKSASRQT